MKTRLIVPGILLALFPALVLGQDTSQAARCTVQGLRLDGLARVKATAGQLDTVRMLVDSLGACDCPAEIPEAAGLGKVTYLTVLTAICEKNKSPQSVDLVFKYWGNRPAEDETAPDVLEGLFQKMPAPLLDKIRTYSDSARKEILLDLGYGFVSNRTAKGGAKITKDNYRAYYFRVSPAVKAAYPRYKAEIDYMFRGILSALRDD